VLDISTVLDAMRSETTRQNRQLMGEACYMLRGSMTGVLLGPAHPLSSLSVRVLDHAGTHAPAAFQCYCGCGWRSAGSVMIGADSGTD
jgi:hypothetical protein